MLTIYSDDHHLHRGKSELADGELKPCFECPERAVIVLEAVKKSKLGDVIEPDDFGLDTSRPARSIGVEQDRWCRG